MDRPSPKLAKALRKLRIWDWLRPITAVIGAPYTREIHFRNLVQDNLRALGVELPPLFPTNGAANYSLLYLLTRIAAETDCKNILEVGAGQSTLFLNALRTRKKELSILTLETDAEWTRRVGQMVEHEVLHRPLSRRVINGREVDAFSDLNPLITRSFDLILIDGPPGTERHSRWATLELLTANLADEFIVIFDDAERIGEQDTIKEFMKHRGDEIGFSVFIGIKCQFVAYSARYSNVQYF